MTVFYLVRHGKKEAVRGDAPLSPQGIREAQATAHALRAVPIRQVYTSPLLRAKQTAALIAACCGLAVIEEERLRERANWGDVPGQSLAEFVEMWDAVPTIPPMFLPSETQPGKEGCGWISGFEQRENALPASRWSWSRMEDSSRIFW